MPNAEDRPCKGLPLSDEDLDAAFFALLPHALGLENPAHRGAEPLEKTIGGLEPDQSVQTAFASRRLLLAVSGGADSLSLMVLCHEWVKRHRIPIELCVASVDHQLRPEAADECIYVAKISHDLGLPHQTLVWEGEKSHSNRQGAARDARYRLLIDHALSIGCQHIAIAHHLDDQAETFLMRLIRGSGVTGLSAMRPVQPIETITLLRPLLSFSKDRLKASLKARALDWCEDPSNRSPHYLRTRVRELMPAFAQEGCDSARLAATARRLQRAEEALEGIVDDFFEQHVSAGPGHSLFAMTDDLLKQPAEIRLRLLRMMLSYVAGPSYPPREEKLLFLDEALCSSAASGKWSKRTVGGCCFGLADGGLWVYREPGRDRHEVVLEAPVVEDWLGLYAVRISAGVGGDDAPTSLQKPVLRSLGEDGRCLLSAEGHAFPSGRWACQSIPKKVLEELPSVWWGGRPQFIADWPKVEVSDKFLVEFEEKHSKFSPNETFE
nr:tRNA lysidine(34) synthetase TilS [uncultured Cohaesibacter sp.]